MPRRIPPSDPVSFPISLLRAFAFCGLLLLTVWAATHHVEVRAQGLTDLFMSKEAEKRIGAEEHGKIVAEFGGVYEDPELSEYVDSIGQFLARTSNAPDVGYTFTVLNSPVVNAFALPGGYVYVTRGLVSLAENEAELAGVIAHEIGHVAARHGAKRHSKNILTGIGLTILGIATESSALTDIASVGAQAMLSSYSREDEFEADQLGVGYLTRAGFAPQAMSSFLAKMERNTKVEAKAQGKAYDGSIGFFASHPRTADRVERAIQLAGSTPVRNPILGEDVFLDKIDGIIYGDDPSQGLIEGQRFVHPDLGFEFTVPQGFKLYNQPTQVIARAEGGAGIKLDADKAYPGPLTDYLRSIWPRDARMGELQRIRVNGMDGATATSRINGQGGPVDIRMIALAYDRERIFRLMFIAPARYTQALNVHFRRTTYSFRRMDRAEADAIKPYVIRVHKVRRGDTIDSLSQRMQVPDLPRDRFMLINGLDEYDRLQPGQRVKLVTR